jgi:hypothetical protein
MQERLRARLNEPLLLMGYDWERYGKWDDDERNRRDREESRHGILAILRAHEDFNCPLTLFVLGKLLEISELSTLAEEINVKHGPGFVDFEQHTYSHIKIKANVLRGEAAPIDDVKRDLEKGKKAIEKLTGRRVLGLGTAHSFHRGLKRGFTDAPIFTVERRRCWRYRLTGTLTIT